MYVEVKKLVLLATKHPAVINSKARKLLLRRIVFIPFIIFCQHAAAQTTVINNSSAASSSQSSSISWQTKATQNLQKLDANYQSVTTSIYHDATNNSTNAVAQTDFKSLIVYLKTAEKNNTTDKSIDAIAANINLIKQHINAKETPFILRILLRQEETGLANELLQHAKANGEAYAGGRLKFEFAKYHANDENWDQTYALLNSFNIPNSLSPADADEAFILIGASLQHLKKHRQSIEFYNRVKADSPHYRVAQLNLAIAYIRQDWWTDGHIAIKNALTPEVKKNDEFTNRLLTVLGFSQLQQGFYRNARESFKSVTLKSTYANRALLGIGLSAMHQEDFVGALNAFNHLLDKKDGDFSISESYLLKAFTLNKLGQKPAAADSYSEAINFYISKAAYYDSLLTAVNESMQTQKEIPSTTWKQITAETEKTHSTLSVIQKKITRLQNLLNQPLSTKNQLATKSLLQDYNNMYMELVANTLTDQRAVMNNYLSQSRFGLAKLYDTK